MGGIEKTHTKFEPVELVAVTLSYDHTSTGKIWPNTEDYGRNFDLFTMNSQGLDT